MDSQQVLTWQSPIAVGQEMVPGHGPFPEGAQLVFAEDGPELLLAFRQPSAAEIAAVNRGPCEFAVTMVEQVIFFLYRFGSALPWSDALFSWHLDRPGPALFTRASERFGLHTILLDADTGVVEALRLATLSPEMSSELSRLVQAQMTTSWQGREDYEQAVRRCYEKAPRAADLLSLATARCPGGASPTSEKRTLREALGATDREGHDRLEYFLFRPDDHSYLTGGVDLWTSFKEGALTFGLREQCQRLLEEYPEELAGAVIGSRLKAK